MTNLATQGDRKLKNFWQKPEGTTGMVVLAGGVVGGGIALKMAMPILLPLMANTIYLGGMIGLVAVVVCGVASKQVRTLVGLGFTTTMRAATSLMVTIDPIGIMKEYAQDLLDKLKQFDEQLDKLNGSIQRLDNSIGECEQNRNTTLRKANRYKDQGDMSSAAIEAKQVQRLNNEMQSYNAMKGQLSGVYKRLERMYQISETTVKDLQYEISSQERQRKILLQSTSAFKSAMSLANGESDKRAQFEMALEFTAEDYANKVGEIDRFMKKSKSIVDQADMDDALIGEDSLALLDELTAQLAA